MAAENTFDIEIAFAQIADYMRENFVAALIEQGHKASGTLIDSIEHKIRTEVNFVALDGYAESYGIRVDTGSPPHTAWIPIEKVLEWMRQKNFSDAAGSKSELKHAFNIQRKIWDVGISQPGSWRGETTKGWLTNTLETNEQRISDDIEIAVGKGFDIYIDNLVRDTQAQFVTQ